MASPPPYSPPSTAQIAKHLSLLPSLIRSSLARHSSTQTALAASLLPSVLSCLSSFLAHLSAIHPPPSSARLLLVPAAAVSPDWALAEDDLQYAPAGCVCWLRRIDAPGAAADEKTGDFANEKTDASANLKTHGTQQTDPLALDGWGRWGQDAAAAAAAAPSANNPTGLIPPTTLAATLFWDDAALATRLAQLLQPEPPASASASAAAAAAAAASVSLPQCKETPPSVHKKKKKKTWRLFGSATKETPPLPAPAKEERKDSHTGSIMKVSAEQVTFRRENELGIWESKSGYGLVCTITTQWQL